MRVIEIFDSIDGEGPRQGMPATFIRFEGCNLRCPYCDTRYSYSGGRDVSIDAIATTVRNKRNITITGGEPLLQDGIWGLIKRLRDDGHDIVIETNGSVLIQRYPKDEEHIRYSLDWKAPSTGMSGRMEGLNLSQLYPRDEIKFVVETDEDIDSAYEVMHRTDAQPILSPVYGKMDIRHLADAIKKRSNEFPEVRMRLQLHKIIWNPEERGV